MRVLAFRAKPYFQPAEKTIARFGLATRAVTHKAVGWNAGAGSLPVSKFDFAFAPALNEFNGRISVQLKVLDWQPG